MVPRPTAFGCVPRPRTREHTSSAAYLHPRCFIFQNRKLTCIRSEVLPPTPPRWSNLEHDLTGVGSWAWPTPVSNIHGGGMSPSSLFAESGSSKESTACSSLDLDDSPEEHLGLPQAIQVEVERDEFSMLGCYLSEKRRSNVPLNEWILHSK